MIMSKESCYEEIVDTDKASGRVIRFWVVYWNSCARALCIRRALGGLASEQSQANRRLQKLEANALTCKHPAC